MLVLQLQNLIFGITRCTHSCQAKQDSTLIDEHVICATLVVGEQLSN